MLIFLSTTNSFHQIISTQNPKNNNIILVFCLSKELDIKLMIFKKEIAQRFTFDDKCWRVFIDISQTSHSMPRVNRSMNKCNIGNINICCTIVGIAFFNHFFNIFRSKEITKQIWTDLLRRKKK